ncbi:spore cortex biosynthesis protein YabQ [Caloramator fervidus]|uniref:Spore cortex biosynthesis protein YabQ n=1 Tax=Caloramator fervidus TaxID=29344 RepID=A0A1H5UXU6_9CLOT|nr:spore cortex biosynthesis protein YabQ [Caloramator fervidus]SEF79833.1 spore cortex biosynthesis protein YabQ [Caloramator fervidus]
MVLDINIQFMYFFSNILCGIIIGFLFDTYRIIRGFKNPNKTLTAISDLLFWIFSALLTFIFMLLTNNVNIRYYTFIAFIIGLYLYFKLISKPFLGSLRFVIYYIMKSFRFLFRMILMFLRLIRVFYLNLGYYVRKFIGLVFIKQQEN